MDPQSRPPQHHTPPGYAPPPAPPGYTPLAAPPGYAPTLPGVPAEPPLAPMPDSYGALLALTMFLVACALGLFTAGAILGAGLEFGTARIFWFGGAAMLLVQGFVQPLRQGHGGVAWLFSLAFALGLGIAPGLHRVLAVSPDAVAQAGGMTAVVVLGAASFGTFTARDLAEWMRPASAVLCGAVLLSWFACFGGFASPPILSMVIGGLSAVMIVLYFNYLVRHATKADIVELATGIFVGIVNLFLSLLRLSLD